MFVAPLMQLDMTPSLGAITGCIGSSALLEQINTRWGNPTGVIFGQAGDPYADRYKALNQLIGQVKSVEKVVQKVVEVMTDPMKYRPITSVEELRYTPVSMQLPILMHAPIRQLFEDDRISGYGYDKENLPEEDFYGRLIQNGVCKLFPRFEGDEVTDELVWEFHGTDPNLNFEDLDAIEETRIYLDSWLETQLGEGGDRLDPTDLSNRIGKAKKK